MVNDDSMERNAPDERAQDESVDEILAEILGDAWELNSTQYERDSGLFHVEWAFQVMHHPEEAGEG